MARQALGRAALTVTGAIAPWFAAAAERQAPVVVGCSGGADSLALTAGVAWHVASADRTQSARPAVRVVVIDHQLQAGSGEVAARAAAQVQGLGLEVDVVPVTVEVSGSGVEDAARQGRLGVWQSWAPAEIWLGHTLDDQAEGVLLGLARGSGARSLSAMAPRRGRLVRPLLSVTRAQTRQACDEWGLEVWDDPHNHDPAFLRSRVRAQVMPRLVEVLGAGVVAGLARSADLLRADADALDAWAEREWHAVAGAAPADALPVAVFAELPDAVVTRVLRSWLASSGVAGLSAAHLTALLALVRQGAGAGEVCLPGARVSREQKMLRMRATDEL